jgi:hypothetical protein
MADDDGIRRISQALNKGGTVPIAPQWEVVDRQTGIVVSSGLTQKGARRSVDKRDNAYGGYRFHARPMGE